MIKIRMCLALPFLIVGAMLTYLGFLIEGDKNRQKLKKYIKMIDSL